MRMRIIKASDQYAIGVLYDCIVISVAKGETSVDDAETQYDTIKRVSTLYPKRCGFICCIEPSSPKPSVEFQRIVTKMFLDVGGDLGAVAHVIEGKGARNALVRLTLMSMSLLKGASQPTEIFKDSINATLWMNQIVALPLKTITPEAIEEVRHAIVTARKGIGISKGAKEMETVPSS